MEKVNILGTECVLHFARYNNETIAIVAENGSPFCTCTVNWEQNWEGNFDYKEFFGFPAVVIKNYSENTGVADDLVAAGVITKGCYMAGTDGGVVVGRLTDKWQQIAAKELGIKIDHQ